MIQNLQAMVSGIQRKTPGTPAARSVAGEALGYSKLQDLLLR